MPYTKTAVITGVTGQDGSYLAELLLSKGYRVVGIKRRTSLIATDRIDHLLDNDNFILVYGNMTDVGSMYATLTKYKPDEVYNLAAQSHVKASFSVPEETVDVTAMGMLRLLEACRSIVPSCRFYQASSSEMFGDNPQPPFDETSALMPASPYACAKVFSHNIIRNYRVGYKMFACSGILFNHESPRRGETFVTRKITMAAARIKLGLQDKLCLGNLDAKRDWGFTGDYVVAMWLILQQDSPDDYVIATGKSYSVKEFLEIVFEHADLSIDDHITIDSRYFRPHEVPYLLGNASKAKNKLGWEPTTSLRELAIMMYEHDLKLEVENKK
jgi:GDPmannose 4,6-dehydratase